MFSQDLERPFPFGLSGLKCSKANPDEIVALVYFVLFEGRFCMCLESRKLGCCSHGAFFGNLIGESAGTWLSAMFDKMAAISVSDIICAMVGF